MGLSGVNFAVAETGSLCLVENEGNGRMCTTVPKVHVAITGIEKVVECLSDVPLFYSALTRSATGQAITTYFNVISGPRRAGELDGPDEVHLVLLDNGRSQAYRDEELRKTLQCIRCGACMNHCPVYTRIGGHAYGTIYPGPIGKIISPPAGAGKHERSGDGLEPVRCLRRGVPGAHPIPDMLQRLRREAKHDAQPGHEPLAGRGRPKPARDPRHAGLCLCRHPPAPLPRRNRGGRSPAGLDAQTPGPLDPVPRSPQPAPRACTPCCARRRRSPEMSSKEAILSRLRGAATPLPTHPTPGSPGREDEQAARALSWHDHRQPRRDPHRQGRQILPGI